MHALGKEVSLVVYEQDSKRAGSRLSEKWRRRSCWRPVKPVSLTPGIIQLTRKFHFLY
jgi:hypothetical protein